MPSEAPVEIVPYDPSWPWRFDEEKKELLRTLAAWLVGPIEHIGSTAIPGLAAKPVIDIMAGVETLDASRPAIAALADLGYFGPLHWYYFVAQASLSGPMFTAIFVIGLFFGVLYERSGNLWIVAIFHAIGNAYIVWGVGSVQ